MADIELDMVANTEVDKVADMEGDKVADMELYMVADIGINIQFGDGYSSGPSTSLNPVTPDQQEK